MHVWCDPESKGERLPFPGSPFHVIVGPGEANAHASVIDEWTKIVKEDKGDKQGKSSAEANIVYAGDTVSIRPQIFDEFYNPTVLPESGLEVQHKLHEGTTSDIPYTTQQKSGVTSYEIRYDTTMAGDHEINVCIGGKPITGAPVQFAVQSDKPHPTYVSPALVDDRQ